MRTALVELWLLALAGGLLGSWIVLRRLAFFSHAVGGAAFPGLVVADATGVRPLAAAVTIALGYAGAVHAAGERAGGRMADALTGVFLAAALATGVVLASDVFGSGGQVDRLLFGSLFAISGGDVWAAAAAATVAVFATLAIGPVWLASGFDHEGARALGAPVRVADAALLALVAVAVVTALPAVGALLTTALFIVPAATARLFAASVPALLAASVALALAEGAVGAYVALWLDAPPGPSVAVVTGAAFCAAALARATARSPRAVGP